MSLGISWICTIVFVGVVFFCICFNIICEKNMRVSENNVPYNGRYFDDQAVVASEVEEINLEQQPQSETDSDDIVVASGLAEIDLEQQPQSVIDSDQDIDFDEPVPYVDIDILHNRRFSDDQVVVASEVAAMDLEQQLQFVTDSDQDINFERISSHQSLVDIIPVQTACVSGGVSAGLPVAVLAKSITAKNCRRFLE